MHRREWYEKGECFDASKIEKHKKKSENGRMIGSGERSIQILQLLQNALHSFRRKLLKMRCYSWKKAEITNRSELKNVQRSIEEPQIKKS